MNPSLEEILNTLRITLLGNPVLKAIQAHELVYGDKLARKIADLADQSVISVWRDEAEAYEAAKKRGLTV